VAATRTASDVQEKVAATVSAPIYKNHWDQGYSYLKNGQYQLAIHEFDKAIQIGGDYDAGAYNNRGHSYAELGQYQTAINDFTKAIQLDPDDAYAYNSRGYSYRNFGQDRGVGRYIAHPHPA